ncbi:MAG: radical SAM protein [Vicinamibacterales bacterium]
MLNTTLLVTLNEWTNRTFVLPVAIFFPTHRCNSRCVSCDWWKANGEDELSLDEIAHLAASLAAAGTRLVLFSGGEPLLRPDVFEAAAHFSASGITLHLHTSGVLLERCATEVSRTFARVIVSLDACDEQEYRTIRGVSALKSIERGVARLRTLNPGVGVAARSTLHRLNFRQLPAIIEHARAMSLDSISFLPADTNSAAFGRTRASDASSLLLGRDEIAEFADIVEQTITERAADFESGFVAESPDKLRRLPQYYAAAAGLAPFPEVTCNAPYISVVIEANGDVRPCFFHTSLGSVRRSRLADIISRELPAFRDVLAVQSNPVCQRCVCSMRTSWKSAPWS